MFCYDTSNGCIMELPHFNLRANQTNIYICNPSSTPPPIRTHFLLKAGKKELCVINGNTEPEPPTPFLSKTLLALTACSSGLEERVL